MILVSFVFLNSTPIYYKGLPHVRHGLVGRATGLFGVSVGSGVSVCEVLNSFFMNENKVCDPP